MHIIIDCRVSPMTLASRQENEVISDFMQRYLTVFRQRGYRHMATYPYRHANGCRINTTVVRSDEEDMTNQDIEEFLASLEPPPGGEVS